DEKQGHVWLFTKYISYEVAELSKATSTLVLPAKIVRIKDPGCLFGYMHRLLGHQGVTDSVTL
ncbi:hypothetical protein, partial [Staphylococcus aureus]